MNAQTFRTSTRTSKSRRFRTRDITVPFLVMAIIVWSMLPFLWLLRSSLTPMSELTSRPPAWLPRDITLENYQELLSNLVSADAGTYSMANNVALGFQNSLVVCFFVTALNVVLGTCAAYGFTLVKSRVAGRMFASLLVARMMPPFAIIVPLFVLYSTLGLYDTFQGLIIAELSMTLPFSVWMIKNYLDTLGGELDEAARVDGANRLQVLLYVIAPVARPALISAAIFAFLASWNSFLFPLVLSSSPTVMTVQPQIAAAYGDMQADYGLLFSATIVSSIPPILIALFLQRFIAQGLTAGSAKG